MTSGDIWSSGAFAFESPLKDLLDSLDYSLEDLLQEDELLQELRGLHPQLITFFSSEENVAQLVKCLVMPPPPPFEETVTVVEVSIDVDVAVDVTPDQIIAGDDVGDETNENEWSEADEAEADKDETEDNINDNGEALANGDDHDHDHDNLDHDNLDHNRSCESEPEPDMSELDISRDTIDSVDSDGIPSPGKWLLDNTSEPSANANENENGENQHENHEHHEEEPTNNNAETREEYENRYIRYPYIACEVICCEITNILDIIVEGNVPIETPTPSGNGNINGSGNETERESILDLLFSMLFTTPTFELDDRRAGYLEKILTMLFRKKRAALTAYINGDHLHRIPTSTDTDMDTDADKEEEDPCGDVDSVQQENGDMHENVANHRGGGIRLLNVLFKHLHSNSIAQIIQKLLMPKPPSMLSMHGSFDADRDHNSLNLGDEDEDDDDEEHMDTDDYGGLNCDWADSEVGLNLILEHLMVEPTGTNTDTDTAGTAGDQDSTSEENEKILNASQHACEILSTVIQHSPLSSNIMKIMTGAPILSRLLDCACGNVNVNVGGSGSPPSSFSMHDSTMTTAMNVLEILILQLGGYGTVPASSCSPQGDYDEQDLNGNSVSDGVSDNEDASNFEGHNHNHHPSDALKEAEAVALVQLLPAFLTNILNLLKHPHTDGWKSHFQYSKKPQQMLGASRLRIVRLLESLVLLSIRNVDLILCTSECLEICLGLFWDFPWCSMLHQSVANLLVHILEGGDERIDLQLYFLNRCNLPKRLMDSFESPLFSSSSEDGQEDEPTKMTGEFSTRTALEMKSSRTESDSSSMDVEQGSDESSRGDDPINMKASNNNVENVIAREEDTSAKEVVQINGNAQNGESSRKESNTMKKEITFRMGYMGHVIIICQALVHACGAMDQGSDANAENAEEKDTADNEQGNDDGSNRSLSTSEHSRPQKSEESGSEDDVSSRPAPRNMILTLLRANRHYKTWINFVTTTLASETAVQSTPLGGFNAQEELNAAEQYTESTLEDSFGGQFDVDDDGDINDSAGFGTFSVDNGDIDIDDVDVDIAASVMESMNIAPSGDMTPEGSGQSKGHNRQRGVIVGQGVGNGTAFGTVVEMHQKPNEYVYDDPLGARHHFDDDLNNDSDDNETEESGDNENIEGDDEAPVMDLFAGNFDFEKTNIEADESDDAEGWANFDDGEFSSGIVDDAIKQPTQTFDAQNDPFGASDVFGIVADNANIISSLENMDDDIDIGSGEQKTNEQTSHIENEEQ